VLRGLLPRPASDLTPLPLGLDASARQVEGPGSKHRRDPLKTAQENDPRKRPKKTHQENDPRKRTKKTANENGR
jgi:hypothetical protein